LAGNLVYIAIGSAGLTVVDVSLPSQPQTVGRLGTQGYAVDVAVSGNLICVADGRGMRVVDVSDPTHPEQISSHEVEADIGVWGVAISGSFAYLAEQQGLYPPLPGRLSILDLSDPRRPQPVGAIDIPRTGWSVTVADNVAYVAQIQEGLRIIQVSDPTRPQEVAFVELEPVMNVFAVEVVGEIAYVATEPMRAVDVSDPKNPQVITEVETPLIPGNLALAGDQLYVAAREGGFLVYRVRREP
jgi:hypothetical protein